MTIQISAARVSMPASPWIHTRPQADARLRLFCLPFAGGSAGSFIPWQSKLAPKIQLCAIQLPGRGARFGEPPISDFDALIAHLGQVVADCSDLPYAFFGHSLGGLLAYELCHRCEQLGLDPPRHLFVSASSAPRRRTAGQRFELMSDQQLRAKLHDYEGTPPEVLADDELMALLLPAIRADFALLRQYRYRVRPKFSVPLSVLAGRQDHHISASLDDWRLETSGPFRLHWFEGGHFFLFQEQATVLDLVQKELTSALR